MGAIVSEITSIAIVYLTVYSGADQRKHQSSASLAFVLGSRRSPVNSPHKGPVMRKMFPFDDVIMNTHTQFITNAGIPVLQRYTHTPDMIRQYDAHHSDLCNAV